MTQPLLWPDEGAPTHARYGDRYHAGRPLEQARAVFLAGCDLPAAWVGRPRWRILETGFGLGSNFLAAWAAWRADPARPARLHYVAIEAHPVARADLERHLRAVVDGEPALAPFAEALLSAWWGLSPGFHPLEFERGCVRLTLAVGDVADALPQVTGPFDSVFLDGFAPARNPAMWAQPILRAIAQRCAHGARAASWCVAGAVRRTLAEAGFRVERAPGLPPKRERLVATFDPPWRPPTAQHADGVRNETVAIVGAGLAGAALADAFARRGARVTVIGAGDAPADGASGIPAGLMAPQHSRDESLMTQLTRSGMRLTLNRCKMLLRDGTDYATSGCLQRFATPHGWAPPAAESLDWTRAATAEEIAASGGAALDPAHALWHPHAAWLKPSALVAALLDRAQARCLFGRAVARIEPPRSAGEPWTLLDAADNVITAADRVIVAAGPDTPRLAPGLEAVRPVAGQLAWSSTERPPGKTPPCNGFGHWLPDLPTEGGSFWVLGSTYEPGATHHEDVWQGWLTAARDRPAHAQAALVEAQAEDRLGRFRGVRATTTNRMPRVGTVADGPLAGVGYLTGLGSRGLSLAVLCAEALAARWCDEPLPVPRATARLMTLDANADGSFSPARSHRA